MASAFCQSFEVGTDGASLTGPVVFFGADVIGGRTAANWSAAIDFVNDNPVQIATKCAVAVRAVAATIRNSSNVVGVTIPANGVMLPSLTRA